MQKPVAFSFVYVSLLYINRCWQQPLQFNTYFACEWVNKMGLNCDLGDFGKGMNECGLQEGVHERCHDCRAASQKAAILKDVQWKEQNTGGPFKTFAMQEKAPGRYMWGSLGKVWLHVMENHHYDQFTTYNSSHSSIRGSSRWSGRILLSFIPNLQSSFTVAW